MKKTDLSCLIAGALMISSAPLFSVLDQNTNGQSDIWENLFDASTLLPGEDNDGDGVSNGDEAEAGTNPFDPNSKPTATVEAMLNVEDEFCITWQGSTGKRYTIWSSLTMEPGSWIIESVFDGDDEAQEAFLALGDSPAFIHLEIEDIDTDADGLNDWEEAQLGFDSQTANSMRLRTNDYDRAVAALGASNTLNIAAIDSTTSESWPVPAVFAIRRSGGIDALTVNLSFAGTATAGQDYNAHATTIDIPLGTNTVWVEIVPLADALNEGDETVSLTLLAGTNYSLGSDIAASVTIEDDTGMPSEAEAARFLTQATFGPTPALIQEVQTLGIEGWIDDQFTRAIGQHQPLIEAVDWEAEGGGPWAHHKMRAWWHQAMEAPDPLRQRIALALSEILVISDNSGLSNTARGMLNYYDMLLANSFGNYRELIEDVTYHPAMGVYLSHRGNQPPNLELGRFPDENFAREIMQLFTIGLWMLNPDGTLQLDQDGDADPTYDNTDITNLARVFTGMSWGQGDTTDYWQFFWPDLPDGFNTDNFYTTPMTVWNGPYTVWVEVEPGDWQQREVYHHDQDAKTLLGVNLPANDPLAPETNYEINDIDRALDVLFAHQNVGPFISRLLIQRLVTSNPTPAYIGRVAAAFTDNGSGVRGDMQAVIKAIFLDPEARDPAMSNVATYGMLKEPYLRLVALARAFNAASPSGIYEVYWVGRALGMQPLSSPSVFNFFQPYYQPPGEIKDSGLVAPEFQITNAVTGITTPNQLYEAIFYQLTWGDDASRHVDFDFSTEIAMVDNPDALLEHLDLHLTYGQMSNELRELLYFSLNRSDVTNRSASERAWMAIYLIATSPEYSVMN
ncbi:DUF1800 family protein [Rubellicoccus peritrichatus]|uniref:DUF1800 family protein n=1 Tax=Rubellicoccus peritrichatus TaxID=3080537 RepID=A0AAQ3QXF5_9BACT|nr:DUF1800 family protein [Puniceicoccus sp. CR14]WOO42810.1 DUF1800 family protein [Puniceicoccus sp. CR14]